jgi:antitoxin component YwqK of YwqJK toxin-antitoxin module
MNKIIILLLFPLLCIGQTETKREYYASGRLLSIINYEDGVRNGSCKYFWDFGAWAIKTDLNYKNGKLIGTSKSYSKQGMLIEEGSYKYTVKGVYSRKDGIWKTYYESGQLKSESIIKDGVEKIKFYDRDGNLQPQNMDGC